MQGLRRSFLVLTLAPSTKARRSAYVAPSHHDESPRRSAAAVVSAHSFATPFASHPLWTRKHQCHRENVRLVVTGTRSSPSSLYPRASTSDSGIPRRRE